MANGQRMHFERFIRFEFSGKILDFIPRNKNYEIFIPKSH